MSADTLTPEEFMQLDQAHHETAVKLYDSRIATIDQELTSAGADAEEPLRAERGQCLTMRKMHETRLQQLREEQSETEPEVQTATVTA